MLIREIEFSQQLGTAANNPSINTFAKMASEGNLVLRPPFQRNLVWNEEQRSYLIDSILRGLPVPEVYIQTSTEADGAEQHIVVDGQQRLSACLDFLNDRLRLTGSELSPRWRNKLFSELETELKARFRGYKILVRELPIMEDGSLREVFQRLNRTVEALEPQELRHAAYTGPYIRFIEAAASQSVLQQLGLFSARDFRRRRNDELLAEIAYASAARAFPNKKEGLEESFLNYEKHGFAETLRSDLSRRFGRVFKELELVAPELRATRFRNKSDFYTLFVLLAKEAEVLPFEKSVNRAMVERLKRLTEGVADAKRIQPGTPRPKPRNKEERLVFTYTRAVERAASDRLSRVRRDDALRAWLGPVLAKGVVRDLTDSDEAWLSASVEPEREDSEMESDDERRHFQEVLLSD